VEAERLQHARDRLQQHSLDQAEYRENLFSWQQRKMKQAADKKAASELQQLTVNKTPI